MTILFTDLGASTLNGGITNVATSLTIQTADVSKFPASGDFYISVDTLTNVELMHVTAGAGTATWTVTRGVSPTAGVAHLSGVAVTEIVSAATLNSFLQDASTTKGDILARSSSALSRLAVGTDTYVLTADSTKTLGMDWKAAAGTSGAMTKIQGIGPLVSAAASFSFPSIPGTYRHLRLVVYGVLTETVVDDWVLIRFNADTSAIYDDMQGGNVGGVFGSTADASATSGKIGGMTAASGPANAASGIIVDIPLYAGTTFHKTALTQSGEKSNTDTAHFSVRTGTVWYRSTSAITQVDVLAPTANFAIGSSADLYGIS